MNKFCRIIITLLALGLLAGCTQSVRSNVMRFHQLPKPAGETIVIVPMNPADASSLEFANYATLVGNALGSFGYRPANGEKADLVVELDYGVDEGRKTIRSSPNYHGFYGGGFYGSGFYGGGYFGNYYSPWGRPYYGRGYYSSLYYGGFYDPFGYRSLGARSNVRTYVNYDRHLKMVIKPNNDGAQNLYEGEVKSTGRHNRLHEVMPYMVQAFFTNFPGESGSSERVTVEIPEA